MFLATKSSFLYFPALKEWKNEKKTYFCITFTHETVYTWCVENFLKNKVFHAFESWLNVLTSNNSLYLSTKLRWKHRNRRNIEKLNIAANQWSYSLYRYIEIEQSMENMCNVHNSCWSFNSWWKLNLHLWFTSYPMVNWKARKEWQKENLKKKMKFRNIKSKNILKICRHFDLYLYL